MTKREMEDKIEGRAQFAVTTAMQAMQNVRQLSHTIQGLANSIRMKSVETPAELGDSVMIDYLGQLINEDGTLGSTFKGGTDYGAVLELGSGNFIAGFEEKLLGIKAGETRQIEVTFPEQYTPELAGKTVSFFVQAIKVLRNEESEVEKLAKKLKEEEATPKA